MRLRNGRPLGGPDPGRDVGRPHHVRSHLVYGFLTTTPNAVVEPIHPKAMSVILTSLRSARFGCAGREAKRNRCNARCRMMHSKLSLVAPTRKIRPRRDG
jgi:putative SOS response-associated peptidase YedK